MKESTSGRSASSGTNHKVIFFVIAKIVVVLSAAFRTSLEDGHEAVGIDSAPGRCSWGRWVGWKVIAVAVAVDVAVGSAFNVIIEGILQAVDIVLVVVEER